MKRPVCADTSVIGGCEDSEWREDSLRLMECPGQGEILLVVSDITLAGPATAPPDVRRHLSEVPPSHIESVATDGT